MKAPAKSVLADVPQRDRREKSDVETPLQPAYFHGVRGCLYDTEILDPRDSIKHINFFRNPVGTRFAHANGPKEMQDTNMTQTGTMDYPCEISPLGFNFFIEEGAHDLDRQEVRRGVFEFMCQSKVYFSRPLIAFPDHQITPDFIQSQRNFKETMALLRQEFQAYKGRKTEYTTARLQEIVTEHNALARFGTMNFLEFSIRKTESQPQAMSFRLKPGESFGARLLWDKTPDVKRPLRLTMVIEAVIWRPL